MTSDCRTIAGAVRMALELLMIAAVPCSSLRSQALADSVGAVALTGVTLIDGTGGPPRPNMTVLIEGERLVAVFPTGAHALPARVRTLKLTGRYVIPGLIDSHVHVATDPSGEDSRARTTRRLRNALLGGVTTVRDMAGDVRALGALQREAMLGDIASPDIYYVALFAGPTFFADPRTHDATRGLVAGQVAWMRAVSDTTDLHEAVAEVRGTGATAIKLYAAIDGELTRRITAEAHRQGVKVWAHAALRPAMPIDVVQAGVDAISHAPLLARAMDSTRFDVALRARAGDSITLDDAGLDTLLREMARQHIVFEPTLLVYADDPARFRLGGAVARKAHQLGVTIIAGTDTLGDADAHGRTLPNLHRELALLVSMGGLSPSEALVSATRDAAKVLGVEALRGTIEAGKLADLVVLRSDPLIDIRNTRSIQLVIKRGRVYSRPWPLRRTRT